MAIPNPDKYVRFSNGPVLGCPVPAEMSPCGWSLYLEFRLLQYRENVIKVLLRSGHLLARYSDHSIPKMHFGSRKGGQQMHRRSKNQTRFNRPKMTRTSNSKCRPNTNTVNF
jgi:hypothetical protein